MKKHLYLLICLFGFSLLSAQQKSNSDFVISFGSCNKQYKQNLLWKEISKNKPDVWIWGGDVVYADTDNMPKLQKIYNQQSGQKEYQDFIQSVTVLGTWDDHDYGANDGGKDFYKKKESQQLFLDFIGVSKNDSRRNRAGVYHSQLFKTDKGSVKIIVLDTRYFRSGLTASEIHGKRYQPNTYGKGTVLGKIQWAWLTHQLKTSTADFNIIVSSIQLLSYQHGFESWGNFPHEVDRLKKLIQTSKAKRVLVLSGDRHISEFSTIKVDGLSYPLIDFTSSGLTHSYDSFTEEINPNRHGKVVSEVSFGLLKFDFKNKKVTLQMRGIENKLQQEFIQTY